MRACPPSATLIALLHSSSYAGDRLHPWLRSLLLLLEFTVPPTPPGDLYGCETKGVAGKAIRKNMKTKGEPIGFATNAGKPEARRGYTPVVTGSMRNRVRPQGIEAPRGACDDASKGWRVAAEAPPSRVFA